MTRAGSARARARPRTSRRAWWASRPFQAAVAVFAASSVGVTMTDSRGPVVGVAAAVFFGGFLGVGPLVDRPRLTAWSRRHPVLDIAFSVPLTFLGLALIPGLALGWAALASLVVFGALLAVTGGRRRRARAAAGRPA